MWRVATERSASEAALQALRAALQLFRFVADGYAQRRLRLALTLVAAGALLTAFTSIEFEMVVDSRGAAGLPSRLSPATARGTGAAIARFGQRRGPAPTRMDVVFARPAVE